jgi:ankyrin repeat protein
MVATGASVNYETKKEGMTALMHAARRGKEAMVPVLVDGGALVNRESVNHRTALMAGRCRYLQPYPTHVESACTSH